MRVLAWIKTVICAALLIFSADMATRGGYRDFEVAVVISVYFILELMLTLFYLRKIQKTKLYDTTEILDQPAALPQKMSLVYKIIAIVLSSLILFAAVNLLLVYYRESNLLRHSGKQASDILYRTTLPAIFVLLISFVHVSFNLLSAFRTIKPHRSV